METELTQASTLESQSGPVETGLGISASLQRMPPLMQEIEESFLDGGSLNQKLLEIEGAILYVALSRTNWNKQKAALMCGLNRTTLVEKCRRHGLMHRPAGLPA